MWRHCTIHASLIIYFIIYYSFFCQDGYDWPVLSLWNDTFGTNIARGTKKPGYWICKLDNFSVVCTYIYSSSIHICMYIQLLECSTYTTFPWCLHYLELSWNLDQPESHQSSRNNMKLVCEMTSILIERTSGMPMSNTKKLFLLWIMSCQE